MAGALKKIRGRKNYPSILFIVGGIFFILAIFVAAGISPEKIDLLYLRTEKGLSDLVLRYFLSFSGDVSLVFEDETLFKKWELFLLIIFWITRSPLKNKVTASLFLIVTDYFLGVIYLTLGPWFLNKGVDYDHFRTIYIFTGSVVNFTFLVVWYRKNKESILEGLSFSWLKKESLEKKIRVLIPLIFLYIILVSFIYHYFEFKYWTHFLFVSAQWILKLIGYAATVSGSYLIGANGTIYMANGCLGFKTMLLFASLVYLTGNDRKSMWCYILGGVLFLNLVNIIRFVLLFIHIQKNGGYVLSIDLHDLYDYIIYTFVFILWVIWFEKFSDLRKGDRGKPEEEEAI